jgi:hypothetical protein
MCETTWKKSLEQHELEFEVNHKIWECPICDETFTDFREAEQHINDCIAYNDIRRNDV